MTPEQYKNELLVLRNEARNKEADLRKKYANANNPYKVGDKVTDHIGSIVIETMTVYSAISSELPCMVYYGTELKANGERKKNNPTRHVYQSNILNNTTK